MEAPGAEMGNELEREVARLAHDLQQPLAVIVNYARGAILRARSGSLSPAELEKVLAAIEGEAFRVGDMLRPAGAPKRSNA